MTINVSYNYYTLLIQQLFMHNITSSMKGVIYFLFIKLLYFSLILNVNVNNFDPLEIATQRIHEKNQSDNLAVNPLTAKLFNLNFHSLEVVSR